MVVIHAVKAAARAQDLDTMGWFARLLDETLNVEMDLHRGYCASFGITTVELETTVPAPTTVAYTSYLLQLGHQGSFPELVASLVPCQWGYWEIGEHLARMGEPRDAPLYSQWIAMYTSPEFAELADSIRALVDRLGSRSRSRRVGGHGKGLYDQPEVRVPVLGNGLPVGDLAGVSQLSRRSIVGMPRNCRKEDGRSFQFGNDSGRMEVIAALSRL